MAAFAHAIASAPNESVVLDIGANVGAYTLLAGALGKRVVAVEMQPGCREWQRCHAAQLGLDPTDWVHFLNRFVATSEHVAPVRVPKTGCGSMASPSAVMGRWPHGLRSKETRKLDKATPAHLRNATRIVRPVHLADYVRRHLPHARSFIAKVDTEGYEILVLESMRTLWPQLRVLLVELRFVENVIVPMWRTATPRGEPRKALSSLLRGMLRDETFMQKLLINFEKRCLLYTSPSPRDKRQSRMPSSA